MLGKPDNYKLWKTKFVISFSVDPIYRRILKETTVGTISDDVQSFNCISFAVRDVSQALEIVSMLDETDFADKPWRFLKQRYDRFSEAKVQRLLDSHRRGQGPKASLAVYLQRYQVQQKEMKKLGHPHTERTTTSSMIDGLRQEYAYAKQHLRIHKSCLDSITEAVDTCLEFDDSRKRDRDGFRTEPAKRTLCSEQFSCVFQSRTSEFPSSDKGGIPFPQTQLRQYRFRTKPWAS